MGTGRIKLFRAHSIIDRFPCGTKLFNGVLVHWFVYRREFPIGAREKYIANYRERYEDEERRLYAEEAIDELFTEEEAIGLKYYLLATQGIKCEIEEAEMPISFGSCGFGAHAVGGPYGYLKLDTAEGYDLTVEVSGYYDLTELIYNRIRLVKKILKLVKSMPGDKSEVEFRIYESLCILLRQGWKIDVFPPAARKDGPECSQ